MMVTVRVTTAQSEEEKALVLGGLSPGIVSTLVGELDAHACPHLMWSVQERGLGCVSDLEKWRFSVLSLVFTVCLWPQTFKE